MSQSRGILLCIGLVVGLVVGTSVVIADAPHTHPDDIDDESDLDTVGQWLGDRMGDIHVDCSEEVGVGSFDACDALDDEHGAFLDQYVIVENETETDRSSDRFETTREDHIEYVEVLEEFYATLDAYEEARTEGDDERAAELAAELRQLEREIVELGIRLEASFEELDAITTIDLGLSIENTNQTTTEASALYSAVESETFIETTLIADANATASFAEAATITGELRDENGTTIENGQIVIDDGDQMLEARTDSDGTFEIEYRPAPVSTVGETEIDVRYEPVGEEPYQQTDEVVAIDIEPTASTVEVEPLSPAAFQEPVSVSGVVQADDVGIGNVPVRVQLNDDINTTVQTTSDGNFEATFSLPMTVTEPATVDVTVGKSDLALEPSNTSIAMSVTETETTLSVTTDTGSDTATVAGQLQTVDEIAIAGQSIDINVGEETYIAETNEDGEFAIEIPAADTERDAGVTYDNPETNLEPSTEAIGIPAAETDTASGITEQASVESAQGFIANNPILTGLLVLVGVGNVLVWGAIGWILWRQRRRANTPETTEVSADPTRSESVTIESGTESGLDSIVSATDETELPPDIQVQRAYSTVRSVFGDDAGTDTRTHWEFYREMASDADPDTQDALRTVTEAFEAATFSPASVDETRATDAVKAAKRCVGINDGM